MISNIFYRPKLESGVKATKWSPCSVYTSSLIKQTSDSILLEVEQQVGGNFATKSDLEVTASAITATVEELRETVSGNTQNIGKLEVTANSISATVDTYIENNNNPNLFPANGWKNKNGEFVDPTEKLMYEYSGGTITSPKIYLEAGTYCASQYNIKNKNFEIDPSVIRIKSGAIAETYETAIRNYVVFRIDKKGEYRFIYGTDNTKSTFYRPKLEIGEKPTAYEPQSIHYS